MAVTKAVYLAGPIRSVGQKAFEWREWAGTVLMEDGFICFDPAAAFHRPDEIDAYARHTMETINRAFIDRCDAVLAVLSEESQNIGTIRELEYGKAQKKPCYLVCEHEDVSTKVSTYDLLTFTSLDDALADILGHPVPSNEVTPDITNMIKGIAALQDALWQPPISKANRDVQTGQFVFTATVSSTGRRVKLNADMPAELKALRPDTSFPVATTDLFYWDGGHSVEEHDNDDGA